MFTKLFIQNNLRQHTPVYAARNMRQCGTLWVRCGTGCVPLWRYSAPYGRQVQKQRGGRRAPRCLNKSGLAITL